MKAIVRFLFKCLRLLCFCVMYTLLMIIEIPWFAAYEWCQTNNKKSYWTLFKESYNHELKDLKRVFY